MLVQCFIERLRPLIAKRWDYIVLWKLSDDNRCMEWLDCCCAGTENTENNNGDALMSNFRASSSLPCRDITFPHQRIKSCHLLDQIPSSMTLDSGVRAQALLSNQVSWLNFSHNSDSIPSEETVGTRVLIPLYLGLVEMFVTKQVPEDLQVIEFIRAQSNFCLDQQIDANDRNNPHNNDIFIQNFSKENLDLPHEISIDRIQLCDSPLDPLQQFVSETERHNNITNSNTNDGSYEPNLYHTSMENGFGGDMEASRVPRWNVEPSGNAEDQINDESFMCENNRSDIDSDQNDEEDGTKYRRRTGKAPSKNLEAERKRRKKLNDRLYALRALVPNISKLDRAAILGDAIEYVKELQKQQENLQLELEQHSDDDEDGMGKTVNNNHESDNVMIPQSFMHQKGTNRASKRGPENLSNGSNKGSSGKHRIYNSKHNSEIDLGIEKVQQMEPQVEVFQLDGNEFLVKVFCEHKTGGFVRLMEALSSLGLEVTSVNTTRHTCLVSSIFRVERKNDEALQADHVKESLLELTRNPSRTWQNIAEEPGNGKETDDRSYHFYGNYSHNSILHSHQMKNLHQ